MAIVKSKNPNRIGSSNKNSALASLVPLLAFLTESGLSKDQLLRECRKALESISDKRSRVKVEHVLFTPAAADIVRRWLRDPVYINNVGRPAELSFKGKKSFTSLAKESQSKLKPEAALKLLMQYGNVKRITSGKYRLVRRFMGFGPTDKTPYEPAYRFICDATTAATHAVLSPSDPPGLFWRCGHNSNMSPRQAREFLGFAKERSVMFLQEVDDWLSQHELKASISTKRKMSSKRFGVGLFGICADSD